MIHEASTLAIGWISFLCGSYILCCVCCFCTYTHIAVESFINNVLLLIWIAFIFNSSQICRNCFSHSCCSTNSTSDIITAKDLINNDIVWIRSRIGIAEVLTINMHIRAAAHIGHTGTAEHPTLRVFQWTCGIRIHHGTDVAGSYRNLSAAAHLSMVTTAIDVTANLYLGRQRCRENEEMKK